LNSIVVGVIKLEVYVITCIGDAINWLGIQEIISWFSLLNLGRPDLTCNPDIGDENVTTIVQLVTLTGMVTFKNAIKLPGHKLTVDTTPLQGTIGTMVVVDGTVIVEVVVAGVVEHPFEQEPGKAFI